MEPCYETLPAQLCRDPAAQHGVLIARLLLVGSRKDRCGEGRLGGRGRAAFCSRLWATVTRWSRRDGRRLDAPGQTQHGQHAPRRPGWVPSEGSARGPPGARGGRYGREQAGPARSVGAPSFISL